MTSTASPVVVGFDGSVGSNAALAWAGETAQRRSAPLRLVYVIDRTRYEGRWQDLIPPAETLVEHGRSLLAAGLEHLADVDVLAEAHLDLGRPASVLLNQARSAQLVVVGSRGYGEFVGLLLGSTSLQVAMHAACPVVVIRSSSEAVAPGPSADRVVVGVDGSEVSEEAVRFAFGEADSRRSGLTAVHAWQWPETTLGSTSLPVRESAEERERAVLSERLAGWCEMYPNVGVLQKTVRADAAAALVAESAGAALTVVGTRGSGGFRGLLLGSVSHAVLHHAGSPVAVPRTNVKTK